MVLHRLFARPKPAETRPRFAPEGVRIYAIGDIHGRRDLLDKLLADIDADDAKRPARRTQLIFLGDLVDRGPDSRGVIERLMLLSESGRDVRFLKGNHEELLIRVWRGDRRSAGLFNRVGGRETLASYGVYDAEYDSVDLEGLCALVREVVPEAHIDFLRGFEDWVEARDYLFVHAGIRPGTVIRDQEASDLRWIRREFTEHEGEFGHMVIHGHTITDGIEERANRIGIDTGAFATGKLTAIGIEGAERWFLST
jgi:serine/threonine protein phosphatase 1